MLGESDVADLPKSRVGSTGRAVREEWISRQVRCKGGKRGRRTDYQLPEDLQVVVDRFLADNPGFFPDVVEESERVVPGKPGYDQYLIEQRNANYKAPSARKRRSVPSSVGSRSSTGDIDELIMNWCHFAYVKLYGDEFDRLPGTTQVGYATDFYNQLVKMSAQNGGVSQIKPLGLDGMVELLKLLSRLGWTRKFPPSDFPSLLF